MTKGWHWKMVLLLLWGVLGCVPPQGQAPLLESPAVEAPTATATVRATPSPKVQPTATRRPWPTRRPTATYTPTPLFALRYEATPVASPQPDEVAEQARALACEPPCWFGLEPGVSTLQDIRELWGSWSKVRWGWNSEKQAFTGHLTNPAFYIGFEADRQGVLTYMEVKPKDQTLPEYAPSAYLRSLGVPPWMARSFVWDGLGGEEPITDTSALLAFYLGYPSRYVVVEMLDFTPNLGSSLPARFEACIPQPDFFVTFFAYPKRDFHRAGIWQKQDYTDPKARFLTTKEEIWEQIVEERDPFCVEMELLDE